MNHKPMTNKQLIESLKCYPPDAKVTYRIPPLSLDTVRKQANYAEFFIEFYAEEENEVCLVLG